MYTSVQYYAWIYIYIYNEFIYIYIYIYIYIQFMEFRLWTRGFHGVFCETTILKQLRKWRESKIEKDLKNTVKNRCDFVWFFTGGCKCVSVYGCAYACMGYSCTLMRVWMKLSDFTNAARCISGCVFVGVS